MKNINVIIHECSADKVIKLISTSDKNIFDGFMNWLKLHNKKIRSFPKTKASGELGGVSVPALFPLKYCWNGPR